MNKPNDDLSKNQLNDDISAKNFNKLSDVLYIRKIINENSNFNLENNYFINYSLYILHKEHYSIYVFFSTFFKNALKEYNDICKSQKV